MISNQGGVEDYGRAEAIMNVSNGTAPLERH